MANPKQSRNRLEMRQSIGRNLGIVLIGAITSGGADTTSVIDTTNLRGGDDEHNDKQILIFDPAGSIVAGEIRRVTDYASATQDLTTTAFSATTTANDDYELWETPWLISDVNDSINQAIMAATDDSLQVKETEANYTDTDIYEYDWLSSYVGIHTVEYVRSIGVEKLIHKCDAAWDELVDGDVTASLETGIKKEGSGSLKLVCAAGLGAGDIAATDDISSVDLSTTDKLEIWVYPTVALDAGDWQVLLDDTAQCASPLESLNIPASSASTWTKHIISLANPETDTAIISVGLKQVTDKGAMTLYADDIKAVKSTSRIYEELNTAYWSIVKGTTNYVKITPTGLGVTGRPTQVRLTGYKLPALLTDDSTDSEIDPDYIIAQATGQLLIGNAKPTRLSVKDRKTQAEYWLGIAERKKTSIRTHILEDTVWI